MCVSNRDRIPTTVAVPDFELLSETTRLILCDTKFTIFSDRPTPTPFKPEKLVTSVLLKAPGGRLRMIYDPVYIDYTAMDAGQSAAFHELKELIDSAVTEFLLEEGEVGFVDNYQVAHGRPQYVPRYDGTDRWLKRTQISSNFARFRAIAVGENEVVRSIVKDGIFRVQFQFNSAAANLLLRICSNRKDFLYETTILQIRITEYVT